MPLPSFIIGGAPKSGTTALWNYLNYHPDVNLGKIKEIRFFSDVKGTLSTGLSTYGPIRAGRFSKGFKWYESFFDATKPYKAYGEASTHYFSAPDSASLIRQSIPEVKLIFMLRDPVARLYSHYWQEYKLGIDLPEFETMVNDDHPRYRWYRYVSSYKVNLERFLINFPQDQLLIMIMDDLKNNPDEVFRTVCNFLNIDIMAIPIALNKKYNQQTTPRNRRLGKLITYAQNFPLTEKIPQKLREKLGIFRRKINAVNAIDFNYPPINSRTRANLVNHFKEDIEFVEKLTGKALDSWRRV